ncbi:zinc finger MYM-type protein 1-like [Ctenocephalides felis]|uniref:zinc finger MYM-type protein 1-like n=1 Tax=Ctenocephalides felis TaxID=7515 RepID=UPI000E6E552F|nr:zinc finger MYM-type protein 1-like [Ctenocephalides felis]
MSERKTKRLSGAQYKRKREEKQNEAKKMFGSLTKFLVKSPEPESSCSSQLNPIDDLFCDKNENELSVENEKTNDNTSSTDEMETEDNKDIDLYNTDTAEIDKAYFAMCMDLNDPACCPLTITTKILDILIEKGPIQNKQSTYPINELGRSFSSTYFYRKMPNGEKFNQKKRWYQIVVRMISVVQFLSVQGLAFRGSSSRLYENNNGNFLKAIEMIGKFDDVMADHINRIQQSVALKNHMPHYAGNRFQNEIISILAAQIQKYILSAIKDAKYFSVILDCTPDMGHVEQITIILRYVHIQNDEVEVRENFVGFSPAQKSTGEAFYDFLIEKFNSLKLNVNDMRGLGYDNGSNMAGRHIGLQKRILDNYPRALFMPCNAHTLNLVVNDAAKVSFSTVDFFSNVSAIYNYFSGSPFRWQI